METTSYQLGVNLNWSKKKHPISHVIQSLFITFIYDFYKLVRDIPTKFTTSIFNGWVTAAIATSILIQA